MGNSSAATSGIFRVSIVISTLGRVDELQKLLLSLEKQSYTKFDVTVVDQNNDDRLVAILSKGYSYPIYRIVCPYIRGASMGRNIGWRQTTGDIVLFADDDCWYPENFIAKGLQLLSSSTCDIVSGRAADKNGKSINGRYETKEQFVSSFSVWTTQTEWVTLFRRNVLKAIGGYDALIGIGAPTPWQAAEGQDIVLRAIAAGFSCLYDPTLIGYHAAFGTNMTQKQTLKKARDYGRGMGYILRKHHTPLLQKLYWLARPAGGAIINMVHDSFKSRYYYESLMGRVEGMFALTYLRIRRLAK